MDFFEAQARAQKRTSRLILLFGLAVCGTIAAGYITAVLALRQVAPRADQFQIEYQDYQRSARWRDLPARTAWWDPQLFAVVSAGTMAVVGLASLYKWHEFKSGGHAVAESVGGRAIDPATTDLNARRLLNVVEEMAIASGTPVPTVYLLPDEAGINAFAAGLTVNDAVIAVTRGAIEKLTRDELQGVIAHEFSHILNGDMRMNLRIASVVFGILVLGLIGRGVLYSTGRMRGSRGKGSGGIVAATFFIGIALMLIGYVGYFFGRLIQAAVSRQREFLADASAVQFTRNPEGIASALKKIGGYALGALIQSNKATAIGHFFFAQAFRSGLTGLWATHPPLAERIRAIEPKFDGRMFTPAQKVDVARESFVGAGLVQGPLIRPAPVAPEVAVPPLLANLVAATRGVVDLVGTLTPQQLANAQLLLEATPPRLRAAAHDSRRVSTLIFGLLLDSEPVLRARQRQIVASRAGGEVLAQLDELEPDLVQLGAEHKLPLLQLTLPALRKLPAGAIDLLCGTLDELVHADERVSVFEFALQKLLVHALALSQAPKTAGAQIFSYQAVAEEISVVMSALARATTTNPASAQAAFAQGVAHLRMLESQLQFLTASQADLATLDRALDRLAAASPPIKQRLLVAGSYVVSADGRVLVTEFELLRAVAAALDCPMPPLASGSGQS
jgi:Zn-dependent protease with chaperone function